jgi:hypothetical protein
VAFGHTHPCSPNHFFSNYGPVSQYSSSIVAASEELTPSASLLPTPICRTAVIQQAVIGGGLLCYQTILR